MEPEVLRHAHVDAYEFPGEFGGDDARGRFKTDAAVRAGEAVCIAGETAGPIAAHLGLAAIAVVITHPEISAVGGGFDEQHAIRAHATMAVADALDGLCIKAQAAGAVVEEHEIISRPVHLCKIQHR